jgi:hypothetical protein
MKLFPLGPKQLSKITLQTWMRPGMRGLSLVVTSPLLMWLKAKGRFDSHLYSFRLCNLDKLLNFSEHKFLICEIRITILISLIIKQKLHISRSWLSVWHLAQLVVIIFSYLRTWIFLSKRLPSQILGFLYFYLVLFLDKFLLKNSDHALAELWENKHVHLLQQCVSAALWVQRLQWLLEIWGNWGRWWHETEKWVTWDGEE